MKIHIEVGTFCFYWYSIFLPNNEYNSYLVDAFVEAGFEFSSFEKADIIFCGKDSDLLRDFDDSKFYVVLYNEDNLKRQKSKQIRQIAKRDNASVWAFARLNDGCKHIVLCPNALIFGCTVKYQHFQDESKRDIDVLFSASLRPSEDGSIKVSPYASKSRKLMLRRFNHIKYNSLVSGVLIKEYYSFLKRSKILLCPLGNGPICGRDFEGVLHGAIIIKPIPNYTTGSAVYDNLVTCGPDYEGLNETIDYALANYNELKQKNDALRIRLLRQLENPQRIAKRYVRILLRILESKNFTATK